MFRRRLIGLLLGASLWISSAVAQEQPQPIVEITYERALALARKQAPALAAARARAREAESHVEAASVWRFNPQLSGSAGPRFGPNGTTVDWSVSAQPDLRALRAGIQRSEAEVDLGRASRVPSIVLGAAYSREESDDIVQGTLTFELPVFDHAQGTAATAEARSARMRAEQDATRSMAAVEANTAQTTAERLSTAARRFEQEGLETLERSERLATASYEAGAVPLGELLAVRRELVQTKLDYADLLLGAATARTEQAASTGAHR